MQFTQLNQAASSLGVFQVDIPIHVLNGDSVLMTFEGCGVDIQLLGDSVPLQLHETYPSVPSTQRVPLPGQVGDI